MTLSPSRFTLLQLSFLSVVLLISLLSPASAFTLDTCPTAPSSNLLTNSSLIPNTDLSLSELLSLPIHSLNGTTYIRPDTGGTLLPYIYTALIFLVHIPVVVVRVVRWEKVQTWCLAATVLTLAITVQGYISTGLAAEKILTWTPVLLVVDAGSMAQIAFLIVEDHHFFRRFRGTDKTPTSEAEKGGLVEEVPPSFDDVYNSPTRSSDFTHILAIPFPSINSHPPSTTNLPLHKDPILYTLLLSSALLLTTLSLQLLGLTHAVSGSRAPTPHVSWCSPVMNPFGLAVLTSSCEAYPIQQSYVKGVGCISLLGARQESWLRATVGIVSLSLVLEAVDILVLVFVHGKTRWRGLKMSRPWGSMILGLVVLGYVLLEGVRQAGSLPEGVGSVLWVVLELGDVVVWKVPVVAGGLRGSIIGWYDGVFSGWGQGYFGQATLA